MKLFLSLALLALPFVGTAFPQENNIYIYEFSGVLPEEAINTHPFIKNGESWIARFFVDSTVPDAAGQSTFGSYRGAVISGHLEFSGGFVAPLDYAGYDVYVFDDPVPLINSRIYVDAVQVSADFGCRFQVSNAEDLSSLTSDVLPEPGYSFMSGPDPTDIPFHQLQYFDEFGSVEYTGDMAHNTQFSASAVVEPTVVVPESFTVTRGEFISGGLPELAEIDNMDLSLRRLDFDTQSRTEFEVKSTSPTASPTSFEFTLEGAIVASSNVVQTIELFNYVASEWELVDTRNAGSSPAPDSVVSVVATGDLSRFVEAGTRCIEARVRYKSDNPRQNFTSNTDQTIWTIQ